MEGMPAGAWQVMPARQGRGLRFGIAKLRESEEYMEGQGTSMSMR